MNDVHRRYINQESVISAVINALLSLAACWLVFGRGGTAVIADAKAFAVDFLPQAFVLSLMSTLIPGAVTRRRIRTGQIPAVAGGTSRLPQNLLLRALVIALGAALLGGGAALLATRLLWQGPLPLGQAYVLKVVFGVMLAIPVTRIGLRATLADRAA
jgi:hypothetical protein